MVEVDPTTGAESVRQDDSLWLTTTPSTNYAPLDGDHRVDAVVVGGGIAGLSTAIALKDAGRSVAVVEAGRIVEGTTGHTTAKLTAQHGLIYDYLESRFGTERARQYAEANQAGIEEVASRVDRLGIDCDFRRRPAYTYTESIEDLEAIHREVDTARRLGLPASYTESVGLPFDVEGAVRFDEQAEFHPRKFLLAIAAAIHGDGCAVYEQTRALDVDRGATVRVETDRGEIRADDVVVASHFPFFDRAGYFARMHPWRSYLLAVRIDEPPPNGMYYSRNSPPETIRSHPTDDGELLIVGGQKHRPGTGSDPSVHYRRCEAYARQRFSVGSIEHRWATHDYTTVDRVPFVGKIGPRATNVYVATGFGGWGLAAGTVAGSILADLIRGRENPWAELFDPQRITPRASARTFLTENSRTGLRMVADRTKQLLSRDEDGPDPGEATVSRQDGEPVARYRDDDGELHAVSAICPHMGCVVDWNDAERTWDCPCHGSRFSYEGAVIRGPAMEDLSEK